MRQVLAGTIVLASVLWTVSIFAAPQTITGQLIDASCYKDNKSNVYDDHEQPNGEPVAKGCAVLCAKVGQPVALLTSDGKVYTVIGALAADKNAKLVPYMTKTVALTGEVAESGGAATIAATDLKPVSQ
jgi:hypothetical protein